MSAATCASPWATPSSASRSRASPSARAGEYLQALTVNVNDYEQILTHRTGDIVKSAVLATTCSARSRFWLYAPAGIVIAVPSYSLVPAVALSWRQVRVYGPRKDEVRASSSSAIMEHVDGMQTLRAYGVAGVHNRCHRGKHA